MSTNPKIFIKRLIEKLNDKDLIIEQQKSFIQQQDKIIKTQINMLDVASGVLSEIRCRDCKIRDYCESVVGEDIPCREVWEKYLQSEVSK